MSEYFVTGTDKLRNGRIHKVEVRRIQIESGKRVATSPEMVTSGWVVDMINLGHEFYSATWNASSAAWIRGEFVDYYLRTHADGKITNNLENLPLIGQADSWIHSLLRS